MKKKKKMRKTESNTHANGTVTLTVVDIIEKNILINGNSCENIDYCNNNPTIIITILLILIK